MIAMHPCCLYMQRLSCFAHRRIEFFLIVSVFFIYFPFFFGKPALKRAKQALKQPNRDVRGRGGGRAVLDREVLNGVSADGTGVKFPIFSLNCSCLLLPKRIGGNYTKETKKNRRETKKRKQTKKAKTIGKIPPTPSTPTLVRTSQLDQIMESG